ncbi:Reverse transcriptase domain-containing protein [Aphis craccivora]|uniref:Reverse transcriptase domain-containing protein n=1 Tax=Aphis craccivora TaxID=307492 RepID=A0A6G0YZX3_APHCR|nr:Reverse transcriptase domain-containing protein [Aphis craccivora]
MLPIIADEIQRFVRKHEKRLKKRIIISIHWHFQLLDNSKDTTRLKSMKPYDIN